METLALPIPGLLLQYDAAGYVLSSASPLHVLSSAVAGAELSTTRFIVSMRVPRDFNDDEPAEVLHRHARGLGIEEPFVGLMTALDHRKLDLVSREEEGIQVIALGTVGLSNASSAGRSPRAASGFGTINLVLLLNAALTPAAMVRSATVATEAKTLALLEAGLRTAEGHPATGTSTDTIVVACTGHGPVVRYAGPVTLAGSLIGSAVAELVRRGLARERT